MSAPTAARTAQPNRYFLPFLTAIPLLLALLPLVGAVPILDLPAAPPSLPRQGIFPLPVDEASHVVASFGDPPASRLAPANPSDYDIAYRCPPVAEARGDCPMRAIDSSDILGNPALVIDPISMERVAFASLHGLYGGGPTNISRTSHTTFTSVAEGVFWLDQPYGPPNAPSFKGHVVLGEDVHAAVDSTGILYVASLYSHAKNPHDPNATWHYTIAQWKFDSIADRFDYEDANDYFDQRVPGDRINGVWLVVLPEVQRVALLWRELAPPGHPVVINGRPLNAWMMGAYTKMDTFSPWIRFNDTLLTGPCDGTTNPVGFQGRIYYGCIAGDGYDGAKNVRPGDVVLHQLDLRKNTARVIGRAPLRADSSHGDPPHLTVDPQGRMALVQVETVEGNRTRGAITTSAHTGRQWSRPFHFDDLPRPNATLGVKDNRINAILYRENSNTIHLVYTEEATLEDRLEGFPMWRKSLVVIDPVGAVVYHRDLDVADRGEAVPHAAGEPPQEGVYGDTRDSLIEVNGREFLGFTDYGVFVMVELVEEDHRTMEMVVNQVPPPPEPVPAAQAVSMTTSHGVLAGAVAVEALRRLAIHRLAVGAGRGR